LETRLHEKLEVFADSDTIAREVVKLIAKGAREAVRARGCFVMAVSGGKTGWLMFLDLAREEVPWNAVHVVRVDERIAPPGDPDRNLA
jgi:6-phosphogluconolactonase